MGLARRGDMYNSHGDKPPLPFPPAWMHIQAGQSTRFVCRSRRLRPRERERKKKKLQGLVGHRKHQHRRNFNGRERAYICSMYIVPLALESLPNRVHVTPERHKQQKPTIAACIHSIGLSLSRLRYLWVSSYPHPKRLIRSPLSVSNTNLNNISMPNPIMSHKPPWKWDTKAPKHQST